MAGVSGGVPQRQAFPPPWCSFSLALYTGKGREIPFPSLLGPNASATEVRIELRVNMAQDHISVVAFVIWPYGPKHR